MPAWEHRLVQGRKRSNKGERAELIRRMVLLGVSHHEIVRKFRDGFVHPINAPDKPAVPLDRQRWYQLTAPRTMLLLRELGEQWRGLLDRADVLETYAGAALERLANLAGKAEEAGNYHAAIRANVAIVEVVGLRTSRWRKDDVDQVDNRRNELEEMPLDELEEEVASRRARVFRLELVSRPDGDVVEGEAEVVTRRGNE